MTKPFARVVNTDDWASTIQGWTPAIGADRQKKQFGALRVWHHYLIDSKVPFELLDEASLLAIELQPP